MSEDCKVDCCLPGQSGVVSQQQGNAPVVLDFCKIRTASLKVKAGETIAQFQVCSWNGTEVSATGAGRPVIAPFTIDNTEGKAGEVQFYTEGDFNRAVIAPLLGGFSELDLSKVGIQLHSVS